MTEGPLGWLDEELENWRAQGLLRGTYIRDGAQSGSLVSINGQSLVNFGSNDYLGLANDPRLGQAMKAAIDQVGSGAGASPLVTGKGYWHNRLEKELAQFEKVERVLLFPTGFAANAGTIPALVGPGDTIYSDAKNHASIIDGCRLSGAQTHIYRHADCHHLADLLAANTSAGRRLIVTDSLFSMDGDLAPLCEIVELAEKHQAMTLVDEAHATGVFGATGRGVAEHLDVEQGITLRIGTLSKGIGVAGGFVAASDRLIEWLRNRARTYMFSTAYPEPIAAAACQALRIVESEPQRRVNLLDKATTLRNRLRQLGLKTGNSASQIVPVILGEPGRAMHWAGALRQQGLFVPGIRPPSVPSGQSLLRISLTYDHSADDLEKLLQALSPLEI